jgi:hypothetical protein
MSDWLAAVHDGLAQRLQACTLCGKRPVLAWGICEVDGTELHIAYVFCESCHRRDKDRHQVEALFEQRYGEGVERLRKENARLKEGRDIFKKAAVYFAQQLP